MLASRSISETGFSSAIHAKRIVARIHGRTMCCSTHGTETQRMLQHPLRG